MTIRELKEKLQQSKGTDQVTKKQLFEKIAEENKRNDNFYIKTIISI
jgi:ribosomal protein S21